MNENVKVEVKGNKAVLTIDLTKDLGASKTGKTNLIAKCREKVEHKKKDITIQCNVFFKD